MKHSRANKAMRDPANSKRFVWLTEHPLVAPQERELLSYLSFKGCSRILEVGCGEGASFLNVPPGGRIVGVDISYPKLSFALRHARGVRFVCADAAFLPFKDDVFDLVFCRDVLHHVEDRIAMAREMNRVCRSGGEVALLEAHGLHPVWFLFGALATCERGIWNNTVSKIKRVIAQAAATELPDVRVVQLPTSLLLRLLLHYRLVWKRIGYGKRGASLAAMVAAAERRILPKILWPYLIVRARKHSRYV